MKTVLDPAVRAELIARIQSLQPGRTANWGRMTLFQMLKHCTLWEEMTQGKTTYKRMFMGRLFGAMALRNVLKDETPLRRSTPTLTELRIASDGNVAEQKQQWIARIEGYANYTATEFIHPFFGKMTREQVGYLAYKHSDHHLRQFE